MQILGENVTDLVKIKRDRILKNLENGIFTGEMTRNLLNALGHKEFSVLMLILSNHEDHSFFSVRDAVKILDMVDKTVKFYRESLERRGLITAKLGKHRGNATEFIRHFDKIADLISEFSTKNCRKSGDGLEDNRRKGMDGTVVKERTVTVVKEGTQTTTKKEPLQQHGGCCRSSDFEINKILQEAGLKESTINIIKDYRHLTDSDIKLSLDHLTFDIQHNKKLLEIKKGINQFFIGIMRHGIYHQPNNYITTDEIFKKFYDDMPEEKKEKYRGEEGMEKLRKIYFEKYLEKQLENYIINNR